MKKKNKKGLVIAFLGPDGSGKSTIITSLLNQDIPFTCTKYFHLKPILKPKRYLDNSATNPHQDKPYNRLMSFGKIAYFLLQYNLGWLLNIRPLKRNSCLIIFDRYYDDLLVDPKRYRYGGGKKVVKLVRNFIPLPDLYFVLTAEAETIYKRKQEVTLTELARQIKEYKALSDYDRYIHIDVNRTSKSISEEIIGIITMRNEG